MEILRNLSCGSPHSGWSIIPLLTKGIASDFQRSFKWQRGRAVRRDDITQYHLSPATSETEEFSEENV